MFVLKATLTHLGIVSWAVPAVDLARMLPAQLIPQTIDPAGELALVSLVGLFDRTLWQTYPQLNERAYVTLRDGSGAGAYFWLSRADSWQAWFFGSVLGIPEIRERLDLATDRRRYRFTREGNTAIELDLQSPAPEHPGFADDRLASIGLNPLIGYTIDRRGLDSTRVVHNDIPPREVRVLNVDSSFMRAAGLIRSAKPLVAWYVPLTPFDIELPPRLVH